VSRVRISEKQVQLASTQLGCDRAALLRNLLLKVGVALSELIELYEVARPPLEPVPGRDQLTVLRRLARQLTRARGVIPDAGLR